MRNSLAGSIRGPALFVLKLALTVASLISSSPQVVRSNGIAISQVAVPIGARSTVPSQGGPLSLRCPTAETSATAAQTITLTYLLSNVASYDQPYIMAFSGSRGWPTGSTFEQLVIHSDTTISLPISFLVPDTASAGTNVVSVTICCNGDSAIKCTTTFDIADYVVSVGAIATSGVNRLGWQSRDSSSFSADVLRRASGSSKWDLLVSLLPSDVAGRLAYEDFAAKPGAVYEYALKVPLWGALVTQGMIQLETQPGPLRFSGFIPNPGNVGTRVSFSLPVADQATIEVCDVLGRSVLRLSESWSAGEHQVGLPRLQPGLYLVRLSYRGSSFVRKGVLLP